VEILTRTIRIADWRLLIAKGGIQLKVQRWPEGPKVNSHAREAVGQAIKLISGPKDQQADSG
jgi:hypothetical protein